MAVWRRFNGKKVKRGEPNYEKGIWIAEGMIDGIRYKQTLRRELFKTQQDAEREDNRIRTAMLSGEAVYFLDKTKLHDFIDNEYWAHVEQENKNLKCKKTEIGHIKGFFPNIDLKHLSVLKVQQFQTHLRHKKKHCQKCRFGHEHICKPEKLDNSTVNRVTRTLSSICRYAILHNKLKDNPVRKVKELEENEPLTEYLTAEQKEKLFFELEQTPKLKNIVLVALLTGWRQGQILNLKASDLRPNTKTVFVTASKQQKAKERPVSEIAWQLLTKLAEETPCDWIFYNPDTKTRIHALPRAWDNARENAGIKNFRFHSLRRTFGTELLSNHVDPFAIRDLLDHSRIDTSVIYAIPKLAEKQKALNEISESLEKYLN